MLYLHRKELQDLVIGENDRYRTRGDEGAHAGRPSTQLHVSFLVFVRSHNALPRRYISEDNTHAQPQMCCTNGSSHPDGQ